MFWVVFGSYPYLSITFAAMVTIIPCSRQRRPIASVPEVYGDDDAYLRALAKGWNQKLLEAFTTLPEIDWAR